VSCSLLDWLLWLSANPVSAIITEFFDLLFRDMGKHILQKWCHVDRYTSQSIAHEKLSNS
jgi:hypothetical protein